MEKIEITQVIDKLQDKLFNMKRSIERAGPFTADQESNLKLHSDDMLRLADKIRDRLYKYRVELYEKSRQ
ncbi:MAG: hypothetical protein EKK37_17480 [Sphingobacteriales bacterium]|nr:MAG: hypothetical protein EKK37_17480 [Sphingobacteriales bacterium]